MVYMAWHGMVMSKLFSEQFAQVLCPNFHALHLHTMDDRTWGICHQILLPTGVLMLMLPSD